MKFKRVIPIVLILLLAFPSMPVHARYSEDFDKASDASSIKSTIKWTYNYVQAVGKVQDIANKHTYNVVYCGLYYKGAGKRSNEAVVKWLMQHDILHHLPGVTKSNFAAYVLGCINEAMYLDILEPLSSSKQYRDNFARCNLHWDISTHMIRNTKFAAAASLTKQAFDLLY